MMERAFKTNDTVRLKDWPEWGVGKVAYYVGDKLWVCCPDGSGIMCFVS